MTDYTFGFVLEQTLGHITHSKNLLANIRTDASVQPVVAPIEFEPTEFEPSGFMARTPLYRNWTIRAGMQARQAVKEMTHHQQVDALFVHTQVPAVLMTNWIKRIPTIVSLDATPLQYDQLGEFYEHSAGNQWVEKIKWRANRACFQHAKQLVTWSAWAKQGLIDEYNVPAEKITVIPPGVNLDDWQQDPDKPYETDTVKILFVGGDLKRKGGTDLIEAFRRIKNETQQNNTRQNTTRHNTTTAQPTPRVELHLVTRTPVVAEDGMFVYNNMEPNSSELKQLFAQSDLFCLPTYGDCLPMVLAEAGAMGLPLISTDVGAISEVVKHEETGLLVRPGDVDELTSALRTLIGNAAMRKQMGEQAATCIRREHDGTKNANHLLRLMKELTHSKDGVPSVGASSQQSVSAV